MRVKFAEGRELSLDLRLWIPDGEGPFPVVLDVDGCWRYMNDDIVRAMVDRGYIAASVDRTEAADDNKGTSSLCSPLSALLQTLHAVAAAEGFLCLLSF